MRETMGALDCFDKKRLVTKNRFGKINLDEFTNYDKISRDRISRKLATKSKE